MLLFEDATPDSTGFSSDKTQLGNMLAWMLIVNGNLYILFVTKRWTSIIAWALAITLCIFVVFCFVYWSLPESAAYGIIPHMLTMPAFWFQWLLCTVVAFFPRFASDYVRQEFFPSDSGLLREVEKFHIRDSPTLHGTDVWSNKDLDELHASWESDPVHGPKPALLGAPTAPEAAAVNGDQGTFADESAFARQTTGSESFDSLLRLRRVADSFSRSVTGSFGALFARVSARPVVPIVPHPNMVYMDHPEASVPYAGFAFDGEAGAADLVMPRHSEHRSRTSSSEDGACEPTHVRWLDQASMSSKPVTARRKSVPTPGEADEVLSAAGTASDGHA